MVYFQKSEEDENFKISGNRMKFMVPIRTGSTIHSVLAEIHISNGRYHWHTKNNDIFLNWIGNRQGHTTSVEDAKYEIKSSWRISEILKHWSNDE